MKIGIKLIIIMILIGMFSAGSVGITLLIRSRSTITELAESKTLFLAEAT